MDDQQPLISQDDTWRGIDFSGLVVVIGAGTGRLIGLLADQVAQAQGQLVVMSYVKGSLVALEEILPADAPVLLMQGRMRQLPVAAECVDLLVVNGVLREVPETHYGRFFEELWRVLVQGGQLRISDVVEPSGEPYSRAWAERNALIRALGEALRRPSAVAVDIRSAAMALTATGYEELKLSLLPGYLLTDAWLEETVQAFGTMLGRLVDPAARAQIADVGLPRLAAAYRAGGQRAAERVVLSGRKVGDLALDMRASFTEDDLQPSD